MSWPGSTAYGPVCLALRRKQAMHAQQVADETILRLIVRTWVEYFYSDFRQTSPRAILSRLGSSAVAPVNVGPEYLEAIDELRKEHKVKVMIRGLKVRTDLNDKDANMQYFDGRKAHSGAIARRVASIVPCQYQVCSHRVLSWLVCQVQI